MQLVAVASGKGGVPISGGGPDSDMSGRFDALAARVRRRLSGYALLRVS